MKHILSGGALDVIPGGTTRTALTRRDSMALDINSWRALKVGVQGQREPWRWPLAPRPRHLLPHTLILAAEDQPLLRRKRVRTLSWGLSLLSYGEPADGCHQRDEALAKMKKRRNSSGR